MPLQFVHPDAPDPAGFGSAAASAYAAGLRFAQGLREAKQAQARQAFEDNQKQSALDLKDTQARADNDLEHRRAGDTPYTPPMGDAQRPELELQPDGHYQPKAQPPAPNPNLLHRDAYGATWLLKDPDAKDAKANATETAGILEKGARPVDAQGNVQQMTDVPRYSQPPTPTGGTAPPIQDTGMFGIHAQAPPGQTVTPAGGKQQYYMPTSSEQDAGKMRSHIATLHAEHDDAGVALPDRLARAYEQVHKLPEGSLNGMKFPATVVGSLLEKIAPEKPTHESFIRDASDPSLPKDQRDRAVAALDLESKYKRKEPNPEAEARAAALADERKQKQLDALDKRHEDLFSQEQKLHAMRLEWGEAMKTPDDQTVEDPETKKDVIMNAGRRKLYQTKIDAAQNQVDGLQANRQSVIDRATKLNGGTPTPRDAAQPAATKTPAPAAQPAAAAKATPAPATGQPAAAKPAPQSAIADGTVISNPKTGERRVLKAGQWVPVPRSQQRSQQLY